jgi:DNA-binding response OmpR family regulator
MHNLTLLYAEDDTIIKDNFLLLLKNYFSNIYVANNGQTALDLYLEKKPDIVILDIYMPKLDGLSVAKYIRNKDEETPIIMITGHSDRELLLDAVNLKLEAYLVKPIDFTILNNTLTKIIEKMTVNQNIVLRDDLTWDTQHQILKQHEKIIKLTKKERLAMDILARNVNKYVSNDALIYHIWDDEIPDNSHDNKLIQLIYRLNKKITEQTNIQDKLIKNSYTLGYRILHIENTAT